MSDKFGTNSYFRHRNDHDDDNAHFFSHISLLLMLFPLI